MKVTTEAEAYEIYQSMNGWDKFYFWRKLFFTNWPKGIKMMQLIRRNK
jgi:hypothetical protein